MSDAITRTERSIQKAIEDIRTDMHSRQHRVACLMLNEIENATPVITGRLRGNWRVGINVPNTTYDWEKYDKNSDATYLEGVAVIRTAKLGEPIFISNTIEYAKKMDTPGLSRQKPLGMRWPVAGQVTSLSGGFGSIINGLLSASVHVG